MQQLKKYILSIVAGGLLIPATAGAFDYNLSIDEISESPLTAYNTIYLGMPKKDFALNFSVLPDWTFYASDGVFEKAERKGDFDGNTVIEGLDIYTANGTPDGRVLAFENYFKCPNKRMAREMYARLSGTIYVSMENFPSYQSDKEIRWIEGDVTIVTYIDERKDDAGYYTVVIRRYNNTVMNQ